MRVLPKRTPENYDILMISILETNPSLYNHLYQTIVTDMVITSHFHINGPSEGLLLLLDMKDGALGHMTRLNMGVLKKHTHHVQVLIIQLVLGEAFKNSFFRLERLQD